MSIFLLGLSASALALTLARLDTQIGVLQRRAIPDRGMVHLTIFLLRRGRPLLKRV
jgi:hypothetical protein